MRIQNAPDRQNGAENGGNQSENRMSKRESIESSDKSGSRVGEKTPLVCTEGNTTVTTVAATVSTHHCRCQYFGDIISSPIELC